MLADALKVNQSLQNLRSVAESSIMHIHTWYIPFMPGSHAMQCFSQRKGAGGKTRMIYHSKDLNAFQ